MVASITLHDDKTTLRVPFESHWLTKNELGQVVRRLKHFTVQDEESSFYLALMKLIQGLPDSAIDDGLYDEVKKVLAAGLMLFRYHDEHFGIEHPDYPHYKADSLLSHAASRYYLQSWTRQQAKSGIHPASLFATRILEEDASDRPLRYLSFCRNPFCSLMTLDRGQTIQYIKYLFATVRVFVEQLPDKGSITYVGFASGQFGRDAIRLDQLKFFITTKKKEVTALNVVFIDPLYEKLIFDMSEEKLTLKEKTQALLVRKSVIDLANFANSTFGVDIDINIHLFPSFKMAKQFICFDAINPTLMCAEDYFIHAVEKDGVNEAEECRDMIRYNIAGQHPFEAFLAYKDRVNNLLYLESTAPELDKRAEMSTIDPFGS